MAKLTRERSISLLNKDFDGFRKSLIKFSQAHMSGVFSDFNETSPGMAFLEMTAYVGDVLSFYMDQQFNELRQDTARQLDNVVAFAKSKGYRPQGKRAARGIVQFAIEVPATTNTSGEVIPSDFNTPILMKGAQCEGPNGTVFETLENVFFTSSLDRSVTGSRFDQTTGLPTYFAIRKPVEVIAGKTQEESFTITDFEKFKTIELSESDVIEVIEVTDSEGNEWLEVDYLAQDWVFDQVTNQDSDATDVPYVLKLVAAPRRFITDKDIVTGKTKLIFGAGDGINFDDELIPNLADYSLPLAGRRIFSSYSIDPRNFLKTRSLGLSPYNTVLNIKYRVGGGSNTNVAPKTIRNVLKAELVFSSTNVDPIVKSIVEGSIGCNNPTRTDGGADEESVTEIKINSDAFYASQNRVVTREDIIARILSLPSKFGKPDKVYVKKSNDNTIAMEVFVLSRDSDGNLVIASPTLKKNIKTYLSKYRMLTDGIDIFDSNIINLKCNFGVVVSSKFNKSEVLAKCLDVVSDYLSRDKMQIGQPIVLSDLSAEIQNVNGVISVYELKFSNLVGTIDDFSYSSVRFDPLANLKNNILYCPENSIFEIKFPRKNIVGVAK